MRFGVVACRGVSTGERTGMASEHQEENELLPITWPFRAAGTAMVFATIWYCLGWMIQGQDDPHTLPGHMPVFWYAIYLTIALVIFGGVLNFYRERKRRGLLEQQ
jgi:hypothetical protein